MNQLSHLPDNIMRKLKTIHTLAKLLDSNMIQKKCGIMQRFAINSFFGGHVCLLPTSQNRALSHAPRKFYILCRNNGESDNVV